MWEIALLFAGLVLFLIGTRVWQSLRGQDKEPQPPKEVLIGYLTENLGLDPKRIQASTLLLSGPMAEDLDLTEVFQEMEEMFGIKLTDAETEHVETVGDLWALVERKIAA